MKKKLKGINNIYNQRIEVAKMRGCGGPSDNMGMSNEHFHYI